MASRKGSEDLERPEGSEHLATVFFMREHQQKVSLSTCVCVCVKL